MQTRLVFVLSAVGIAAGLVSAVVFAVRPKPAPPVFDPAPDPYERGIYANGIVESDQASGENVNVVKMIIGTASFITRFLR